MRHDRTRARQRRQAVSAASAGTQDRGLLWSSDVSDLQLLQPRTLTRQVWDDSSALSIPGVAKALHIHQLIGTMPLTRYRGVKPLPQTDLLRQPDLTSPGSTWYVQQHLRDWLLHGNAIHLITGRDRLGTVQSTRYYPARNWDVRLDSAGFREAYWLNGVEVPFRDVVHVQRGQHPLGRGLGVGIVEQHLLTLDRAKMEEESERQSLRGGAVPSVAVITPQKNLTQLNADKAADSWNRKLAGPGRQPVILPNGTQVVPLGWSAADNEMTEARKMTLTDLANITGMDGYWLGAPGSSHTYRSPGPLWLALLRMTLEAPIRLLEDAWGQAWMPATDETLKLDRLALTEDDIASEVNMVIKAVGAGIWTWPEGRVRLKMDPSIPQPGTEGGASGPTAVESARELAEMVQKIYLGAGKVISVEEAREILNRAGADLSAEVPEGVGMPAGDAPAVPADTPEETDQ